MKLHTGFDLHSCNSYVGIIDEQGKRAFNSRCQDVMSGPLPSVPSVTRYRPLPSERWTALPRPAR
jgi:hypothetical protein